MFSSFGFAERKFTVGLEAGYFMPTDDDFNDIYGSGSVFGLNAGYGITENIELLIGGNFYSGDAKTAVSNETVEISLITARLGVFYLFDMGKITPKVGAGIAYASVDEDTPFGNFTDSGIGWFAAAGVDMPLGKKLLVGAEILYSDITIEGDFGDQTVGGLTILVLVRMGL
jgi:opacity protein-like surface antigen